MHGLKRTILCLLACGACAGDARAQTVDITINGRVTPGTCSLSAGSENQTVRLRALSAGEIAAASGAVAASREPFSVQVEDCAPSLTTATFAFQGTTLDAAEHVLVNTGTATGVGIEMALDDGSNGVIVPNTGQYPVAIASRRATLRATAAYYHPPGAPVGAGSVIALATVVVTFR
ncbi:fimbrial protein [[Pseudomonas] boreopolis]|uniref:fimbrial protein n=1 Tax=Xanthomonas boreopolis TaxID=86183 RepID=UPI003D9BFD10